MQGRRSRLSPPPSLLVHEAYISQGRRTGVEVAATERAFCSRGVDEQVALPLTSLPLLSFSLPPQVLRGASSVWSSLLTAFVLG